MGFILMSWLSDIMFEDKNRSERFHEIGHFSGEGTIPILVSEGTHEFFQIDCGCWVLVVLSSCLHTTLTRRV